MHPIEVLFGALIALALIGAAVGFGAKAIEVVQRNLSV
jgi:hypothetical protein